MADVKIRDMAQRTFAAGDAIEVDNGTTDNHARLNQTGADLLNAADATAARTAIGTTAESIVYAIALGS